MTQTVEETVANTSHWQKFTHWLTLMGEAMENDHDPSEALNRRITDLEVRLAKFERPEAASISGK